MRLKVGTVCSGIGSAEIAAEILGMQNMYSSEIEDFPIAVLENYFSHKIYGDFTQITDAPKVDLLVGGPPCQSFSSAGKGGGLDDPRGHLSLEYFHFARRNGTRWIVFENTASLLNKNRKRDFGTLLGALGKLGYGFAYRVFDSSFFGVPQKRRRVFIVGYLGGGWAPPAAVLFESKSLSGNIKKSKEEDATSGGGDSVMAIKTSGHGSYTSGIGCLRAHGGDVGGGSETLIVTENQRSEVRLRPIPGALSAQGGGKQQNFVLNLTPNSGSISGTTQAVTTQQHNMRGAYVLQKTGTLTATYGTKWGSNQDISNGMHMFPRPEQGIRRLTPLECERLQGFPDNWTNIDWRGKPAPDGRRYHAVGNSIPIPFLYWIMSRIQKVDQIIQKKCK